MTKRRYVAGLTGRPKGARRCPRCLRFNLDMRRVPGSLGLEVCATCMVHIRRAVKLSRQKGGVR